jgi:2-methylcitrate dehydratase PrpD
VLIRGNDIDHRAITGIRLRGGRRILIGGSRRPDSMLAAITSAPFLAAFAFVHQREFLDDPHFIGCLTPAAFADQAVVALAERVEVEADEQIDYDFEVGTPQRFGAQVTVTLADGRVLEHYADIWPATSGMTFDEVARKFRNVVRGMIAQDDAERLIDQVSRLDEIDDVSCVLRTV